MENTFKNVSLVKLQSVFFPNYITIVPKITRKYLNANVLENGIYLNSNSKKKIYSM